MRRFVALSLVAAAAIAASGTAHAQSQRGEITRAEVEERTTQSFARRDANGDGKLDAADRDARRKQTFDRIDADGNGAISLAEFTARRDGRSEARAEGEGRKGPRSGRGGQGMARTADADNDGAVTQAEFASAALERFDQADTDRNGTVSRDERRAARGPMRHRRQPREAG